MKKLDKEPVIVIVILLFIVLICIKKQIRDNAYIKLAINDETILISNNSEVDTWDLETLNSEQDVIIKNEGKNSKIRVNQKVINPSEELSLGKIEIDKENKIEVEVKLYGEIIWKKYTINTLPTQFPEYEFQGKSEENGEYYVTTYNLESNKNQHYIYKLNEFGKVTFYKATPTVCYNFKKNVVNEKIRYTYLESYETWGEGFTMSLPTKLVVLDEKYKLMNELYYFAQEKKENMTELDKKLDNHDYLYLDDNHYILSGFEKETVFDFPGHENEAFNIWNCKIQEVLNGEIVWEFQSIKNKQIYNYCDESNREVMTLEPILDCMHFNSMRIDPLDKNLVCSFRNIDCLMKLDRKTGEICWVLGGNGDEFGLTEEQQFSNQHSISFLSDHSILIYDNGCANQKTRIIKIKLDEKNKTVEKFSSYDLGIFANRMGSVQAINEDKNIYLVTYGVGDNKYGFQELNLETLEPITSFTLNKNNSLYCVNKSNEQ